MLDYFDEVLDGGELFLAVFLDESEHAEVAVGEAIDDVGEFLFSEGKKGFVDVSEREFS